MISSFTKSFMKHLGRPIVFAAFGIVITVSIIQTFLIIPVLVSLAPRLGLTYGPANIFIGLVIFALLAAVQFHLSRRLGNEGAPVGEAALGAWLGFTLLYLALSKFPAGMASGFFMLTMKGNVASFAFAMTATTLIIRLCLFPLLIYLTALAQDSGRPGFGAIVGGLARRPALCAGYALLCVAFATLSLLPAWLRPSAAGRQLFATIPLLLALGQVIFIVYAVTAYHVIQGGLRNNSHVFD